jgi:hypothetical protein
MVKATSSCRVPVGLVSTSQDSHALPFNAKGWVVNGARSRATSGLSGGERNGPYVTVTRMASSDDLLQPLGTHDRRSSYRCPSDTDTSNDLDIDSRISIL